MKIVDSFIIFIKTSNLLSSRMAGRFILNFCIGSISDVRCTQPSDICISLFAVKSPIQSLVRASPIFTIIHCDPSAKTNSFRLLVPFPFSSLFYWCREAALLFSPDAPHVITGGHAFAFLSAARQQQEKKHPSEFNLKATPL